VPPRWLVVSCQLSAVKVLIDLSALLSLKRSNQPYAPLRELRWESII